MKKRILLSLSILMGMATFFIPCLQAGRAASPSQPECPPCDSFGVQRPQEKKEAPAFSLKSLDGNQVSLRDFRGKPVLIVFWATWCDSCKEEMPVLEKFSQGKRDQLTILLIAIDGERKRKVQQEKVMDQYGVRGWIPLTFLIDQEGMLVGKIVGQRDWSSAEAWSSMKELFSLR
jgi:thiol-disulfide isomerase/thioredoxin